MGKKRTTILGSEDEAALKAKKAVKLEQKKLREGKSVDKQTLVESPAPVPISTPPTEETSEKSEKVSTKKVHVRSKAYQSAKTKVNPESTYPLSDALSLLRQVTLTKFDPTVELHITLKTKSSNIEVNLPHSTGKVRRIAVANDETVAKIEKGIVDFDVLFASPAQMGKLVKFARTLGPRGLMPNPKNGTVTADPDTAAKNLSGKNTLTLKNEKDAPIIHTIVGKLSFKDADLVENISAILSSLPANQTKKIVLKSTMSPAIKIQL